MGTDCDTFLYSVQKNPNILGIKCDWILQEKISVYTYLGTVCLSPWFIVYERISTFYIRNGMGKVPATPVVSPNPKSVMMTCQWSPLSQEPVARW